MYIKCLKLLSYCSSKTISTLSSPNKSILYQTKEFYLYFMFLLQYVHNIYPPGMFLRQSIINIRNYRHYKVPNNWWKLITDKSHYPCHRSCHACHTSPCITVRLSRDRLTGGRLSSGRGGHTAGKLPEVLLHTVVVVVACIWAHDHDWQVTTPSHHHLIMVL